MCIHDYCYHYIVYTMPQRGLSFTPNYRYRLLSCCTVTCDIPFTRGRILITTSVFRGIEKRPVNVYKYNWKLIKTNAHQCTYAAAQLRMRGRNVLGVWTSPVPLSSGNVNRNSFTLKVNNNSNEIVLCTLCLNVCITWYLSLLFKRLLPAIRV